jgi:predicted phosphoadenosine phosphosulfate sulfurtransferase
MATTAARASSSTRRLTGQNVFDAAVERLVTLYEQGHRLVYSFSAGKDSGVCVELGIIAARIAGCLPIDVVLRDEEIMFPGTYEYAERVFNRPEVRGRWLVAHQPVLNICSRADPYFWVFDPLLPPGQWVREPPPWAEAIPGKNIDQMTIPERFPPAPGATLYAVMGIRTSESRGRLYGLFSAKGHITLPKPTGVRSVWPIYDWSDSDVWLAHQRFGWDYNCNPAEAPIWMGDYSFKPIARVQPGDTVIGFERREAPIDRPGASYVSGAYARDTLVRSQVLAVHERLAPVVKITLASGAVVRCTPDHQWITLGRWANNNWRYDTPEVGRDLARVVELPRGVPDERAAAWLGGLYDGEGSGHAIYQNPTHNPEVYAEIGRVLELLEVPHRRLNGLSAAQHGYRITNGRAGLVRFLNATNPVRRATRQIDQIVLGGRFKAPDRIIAIQPDGVEPVYALETTTGNYVAWGYASKNSAYNALFRLGIPKNSLRIAPPTMNAASVGLLKAASYAWPDWFDRVCTRLPGVRQVALFGNAALVPQRRSYETWEETFRRECLGPQVPDWIRDRAQRWADRIVSAHAHHTAGEPLPQTIPCHPCFGNSGCWRGLTLTMWNGDPFSVKCSLPYVEPEFFRPGAGTWGGRPAF